MNQASADPELTRMREAAFDAFARLDSVWPDYDPATFYPPMSETLVWVTALAESMGIKESPLLSGLAYARNCTLHGRAVVTYANVSRPGAHKVLKGEVRWGAGIATVYVWGFTEDPEPYDGSSRKPERHAKRRRDFNENIAGYSVQSRLHVALQHVGVNIEGAGRWASAEERAAGKTRPPLPLPDRYLPRAT